MYRFLLGVPASAFAFLSGLMVSVATSAAAQVAFADHQASNRNEVLTSGAVALVAGIFWFVLSEIIGSAIRKIDAFAPALKSREAAISSLPRRAKIITLSCFGLACSFSLGWPWVTELERLRHCLYGLINTLLQQ